MYYVGMGRPKRARGGHLGTSYLREDGALSVQLGVRIPIDLLDAIEHEAVLIRREHGLAVFRTQVMIALMREALAAREAKR
jgi:hypothetical protein